LARRSKPDCLPKHFVICLRITNISPFQPVKTRLDRAVLPTALQGLGRAGDPEKCSRTKWHEARRACANMFGI